MLDAGLITALTLAVGTFTQLSTRNLEAGKARALGLGTAAAGLAVAALAASADSVPLAFVAAVPLGTAYGLCLASGLGATEHLAAPHERGAATAAFLALTYIGFAAPWAITTAASRVGAVPALAGASALAGATALATAAAARAVRRTPDRGTR